MNSRILVVGILLLFGCNSGDHEVINTGNYIDISGFFRSEIERLDSLKPDIIRYSEWNRKKSTDTVNCNNWGKELVLFREVKIPKAMWRTDYELIDSMTSDGQFIKTYGALYPKLDVRLLRVVTDATGNIMRVEVEIRRENKLVQNNRKMSYSVDKGYTIAGARSTTLMGTEDYKIVCQLIKP